jgi:hypothetical protein
MTTTFRASNKPEVSSRKYHSLSHLGSVVIITVRPCGQPRSPEGRCQPRTSSLSSRGRFAYWLPNTLHLPRVAFSGFKSGGIRRLNGVYSACRRFIETQNSSKSSLVKPGHSSFKRGISLKFKRDNTSGNDSWINNTNQKFLRGCLMHLNWNESPNSDLLFLIST